MSDAFSEEPPRLDDAFDNDGEQRVYGTVLQTREPTTAGAIADRADCGPKTARKYLEWFAELGIVTRHQGQPITYERNDAYFEWRRVDRLATEHSVEELVGRVQELTERIARYEREYDAERPSGVDAVAAADRRDRTVDDVYGDLADWATALRDRDRHERARQRRADAESGSVLG